jgi:hypothetical protein
MSPGQLRKLDDKACPATGAILHPDSASVGPHVLRDDGEPESRAVVIPAVTGGSAGEPLEHPIA